MVLDNYTAILLRGVARERAGLGTGDGGGGGRGEAEGRKKHGHKSVHDQLCVCKLHVLTSVKATIKYTFCYPPYRH